MATHYFNWRLPLAHHGKNVFDFRVYFHVIQPIEQAHYGTHTCGLVFYPPSGLRDQSWVWLVLLCHEE